MNNPTEPNNLRLTVFTLSNEAFNIAQRFASGLGDQAELNERAKEINSQLDGLWPLIQLYPAGEQADISQSWSDARLDVDYVLSNGELSTSTRLYHFLQNLKK